MSDHSLLGTFEERVLLAVIHCRPDAYGMTIRREMEERMGRSVSLSAVYTTLERLKLKGYVETNDGDPSTARRGRARRYVALLPAGALALTHTREATERMWGGLSPDGLMEDPEAP